MKLRTKLLAYVVGFALGLATLGVGLAQVPSLILPSPTGLEQIEVFQPSTGTVTTGPQKVQVTINQIRNATGYNLIGAGTTVATTIPNTAATTLAIGAITTWNVVMPTAPEDGQMVKLGCPGGNVGTLNLSATAPTGVTIVGAAFTGCTEATPTDAAYLYNASGNIWYRTE